MLLDDNRSHSVTAANMCVTDEDFENFYKEQGAAGEDDHRHGTSTNGFLQR